MQSSFSDRAHGPKRVHKRWFFLFSQQPVQIGLLLLAFLLRRGRNWCRLTCRFGHRELWLSLFLNDLFDYWSQTDGVTRGLCGIGRRFTHQHEDPRAVCGRLLRQTVGLTVLQTSAQLTHNRQHALVVHMIHIQFIHYNLLFLRFLLLLGHVGVGLSGRRLLWWGCRGRCEFSGKEALVADLSIGRAVQPIHHHITRALVPPNHKVVAVEPPTGQDSNLSRGLRARLGGGATAAIKPVALIRSTHPLKQFVQELTEATLAAVVLTRRAQRCRWCRGDIRANGRLPMQDFPLPTRTCAVRTCR